MKSNPEKSAPVADAVREAREREGLTVRELSRRAGISHTQISRLESGEVSKPSREILVALGRGLDRNPIPLLILAGYYDEEEAVEALKPMFREDAELPEAWPDGGVWTVDEANEFLFDPDLGHDIEELKGLAADVFSVPETDETLWDPSYLLAAARGDDAWHLQRFMATWRYLDSELRARWLDYGLKLRKIADLDYRVDADLDRRDKAGEQDA
ncbi:MAG: helix-turn-helix transcriptional regulator [Solirubrobacterales bacterium]|nr:helix-turn-helix transcriptional regulator [Solirubrobacterales bacterium]